MNNKNSRKKQKAGNNPYFSNTIEWSYTDEERLTKSKDLVNKLVDFWMHEYIRFQKGNDTQAYDAAKANFSYWSKIKEKLEDDKVKYDPQSIQKLKIILPSIQIEFIRLSIANFKGKYEFLKQNLDDIDLEINDLKNKIQENSQSGGLKRNKKQSGGNRDCGCSNNRRLEKRK